MRLPLALVVLLAAAAPARAYENLFRLDGDGAWVGLWRDGGVRDDLGAFAVHFDVGAEFRLVDVFASVELETGAGRERFAGHPEFHDQLPFAVVTRGGPGVAVHLGERVRLGAQLTVGFVGSTIRCGGNADCGNGPNGYLVGGALTLHVELVRRRTAAWYLVAAANLDDELVDLRSGFAVGARLGLGVRFR